MDNNNNSLISSKDYMIGKEEISEEYNKLYNTKFIILSVINDYIHIYHAQMKKLRSPFTRPRILIKGNESEYKLNYIPAPNLNKLYSLPVSNFHLQHHPLHFRLRCFTHSITRFFLD